MAEKLLFAPFAKIDKENRIVSGYATLEVPDKEAPIPDVVDYESAKKAFASWIGNIREMHLPIAVGKAIEVVPDDEKRGIYLAARISKSRDGEDAWTKIQEGVLTGFSIGPKGITRSPEAFKAADGKTVTVNRLKFKTLAEVSLADNGACPGTLFDVVKSAMPDVAKTDNDPNVGGGVDRDKLPAADFVDPARRRFPIVTAGDVSDAVSSYGRANPKIPFATFKRRLTAIATRKGFASALPKEWTDGEKAQTAEAQRSRGAGALPEAAKALLLAEVKKCDACDVHQALDVLHLLTALIDGEAMEQAMGSDEQDDLEQLRAAFELVLEFVTGELDEFLQQVPAATDAAAQMAEAPEETKMTQADVTKIVEAATGATKALVAEATKDLAGKAEVALVSEGLGKVTTAVEAAATKTDLAGLTKRVDDLEKMPASGPVLRTEGLAAAGLHVAEKGAGGGGSNTGAKAILADIDKQIDAASDPVRKEALGQLRVVLALKYDA